MWLLAFSPWKPAANVAMKRFLLALLLVLVLWGAEYAFRGYWEPDEPRFVLIAREMENAGKVFIPIRNGVIYAHKPPLMIWLIQLGEVIFPTPFGSRLPSFLGALLSILAIHAIGRRHASNAAGWISAVIFATCWEINQVLGRGQIDGLLTGLELLSINLLDACRFSRIDAAVATGPSRASLSAKRFGAFALMGLAILAKGPVGLLIPLGSFLCFAAATPPPATPSDAPLPFSKRTGLTGAQLLLGCALAIAIPVLWLVAAYLEGAPHAYFREILIGQNLERAAGSYGHIRPFYYLFLQFLCGFLPWILFLPVAARHWGQDKKMLKGLTFWILFVLLFFSLPASKRSVYILSAFAPAALVLGIAWQNIVATRAARILSLILLLLLPFGFLAAAVFFHIIRNIEPPSFIPPELIRSLHPSVFYAGALLTLLPLFVFLRKASTATLYPYCLPAAMFLLQVILNSALLPAIGPLKEPRIMARLAEQYCPLPSSRLLLYNIFGENLSLHANRFATRCNTDEELTQTMITEQKGLAVFLNRDGTNLVSRFPGFIRDTGTFSMGRKKYLWASFEQPDSSPDSPSP